MIESGEGRVARACFYSAHEFGTDLQTGYRYARDSFARLLLSTHRIQVRRKFYAATSATDQPLLLSSSRAFVSFSFSFLRTRKRRRPLGTGVERSETGPSIPCSSKTDESTFRGFGRATFIDRMVARPITIVARPTFFLLSFFLSFFPSFLLSVSLPLLPLPSSFFSFVSCDFLRSPSYANVPQAGSRVYRRVNEKSCNADGARTTHAGTHAHTHFLGSCA